MGREERIQIEVDGMTILSAGKYYEGNNRWVAHQLKDGNPKAIEYAAKKMAVIIPEGAVLVPIPGHHGTADLTLKLAKAIAAYTDVPVVDALRGEKHESQYRAKCRGLSVTEEQMGFKQVAPLPKGLIPLLVDNVVDTGVTAKAAFKALGTGVAFAFALSDTLLQEERGRGMKR